MGPVDLDPGRAGSGEWTRSAVEQAAVGVYRVPLPLEGDALRAVNVYVLVHEDRVTLIDSGWSFGNGMDVLEHALASLDIDLGQIERVLVTHFHRDHYTLAIRLRQRFGTTVVLGSGDRESVEAVIDGLANGRRSWLRHWGAEALRPRLDKLPAQPPSAYELPNVWLDGPQDLVCAGRTLRALPTPGHTRGHFVFADLEHGLLFAGDHLLPEITPSIGVEPAMAKLPLATFLSSLQLMYQMPDLALLPAHGPLGQRSHHRTDELLAHHRHRLALTARAVREAPGSAYDVAQRLPWTRRQRVFADLDPENQLLAVSETAAHLDVLVGERILLARNEDGTRTYAHRSDGGSPCVPR